MTTAPEAALTLAEAVPLGHALVHRVAETAGVRLLFLKGPAAHAQGLRPERESHDVDVLVEPGRQDDLRRALHAHGWEDVGYYIAPTAVDLHSATVWHRHWPHEVDLHARFPGLLLDEATVFERLWSRRDCVVVAHRPVPVPDPLDHLLVLVVHRLRSADQAPIEGFVERARAWDPAQVADRAQQLGCSDSARPLLDALGVPPAGGSDPARLAAWRDRAELRGPGESWGMEWRRTPWSRRPALAWSAMWLSEAQVRAHERNLPPGRAVVWAVRRDRWLRGVRALARRRSR